MIIRSTGAIRRITGRGQIRRLSGEAKLVQGRMLPRAQVGLVSDAVEVYDPSNILTVAEDLEDGSGVRLGVSGVVGTADPETGATFSVRMRDVARRELGPASATKGRIPIQVTMAAEELAAWATHAAPSGNAYWVGIADGPLGTCEQAVLYLCLNDSAGQQRVGVRRKTGASSWDALHAAPVAHAGHQGVIASLGLVEGHADNKTGAVETAYPYVMTAPTALGYRVFSTDAFSLQPGRTPHLVWGAGGPAADVIEFAALAVALGVADLRTLVG